MKFLVLLCAVVSVTAVAIEPRHNNGRGGRGGRVRPTTTAAAIATSVPAAGGADTPAVDTPAAGTPAVVSGSTLVLKEVNGVPGNECLTFRNNGEIVDAACVNTAADRQLTPATIGGASALRVQRTFSAGFRPDLVNVEACVGFNGTHFRAEDCAASGIELVALQGNELRAPSGACASGHDDQAQVTVDPSGTTCATFTTTEVTPAN